MEQGWIKLHRVLREHWLWTEERVFNKAEAWIDILLMVNHADSKVYTGSMLTDVKAGSMITSIKFLAERWQWSRKKVSSFLDLLESDGMISQKRTSKNTVLTVINWEFYQGTAKVKHITGTPDEHQRNIIGTSEAHQRNTNKNDKNVKNEENVKNKEQQEEDTPAREADKVFLQFVEQELCLLLSGTAIERVNAWLDEWSDREVIKLAVKEAVLNDKRNIAYVDAILRNWHKQGITTLPEAQAAKAAFAENKAKQKMQARAPSNRGRSEQRFEPDNFETKERDLSFLVQ